MNVEELITQLAMYPGSDEVVDDLGYDLRRLEPGPDEGTLRLWFED